MAIGYMYKKSPLTFGVACRILTELKYRDPDFSPKTFMDFGAGMGIFIYFLNLFVDRKRKLCIFRYFQKF